MVYASLKLYFMVFFSVHQIFSYVYYKNGFCTFYFISQFENRLFLPSLVVVKLFVVRTTLNSGLKTQL